MALLPLLIAIGRAPRAFERPRPFRAFLLGLTTGVTYFCGTLYWLADVMATFGGIVRPLAIVLALLLIAYLALYPALFTIAMDRARRRIGPEALLIAPAVWVATELGRSYALTGFPWVLLGNSQVSVLPIAQAASVFGVYGLSALVAAPAAAFAYAWYRRGIPGWSAPAVAVALVIGVGAWGSARVRASDLLREGQPLKVGVVQGNIAQTNKWNRAWRQRILDTYLDLSRRVAAEGVSLIVWPEASTPFIYDRDTMGSFAIRQLAAETGAFLLIGTDEIEREPGPTTATAAPATPLRYYNSAYLVQPDGRTSGVYRKMQLVPFGEYVPFRNLLFFAAPIVEAVGDATAGERVEVLPLRDGVGLSTAICYEAVFPHLARAAVLAGSQLLTTITNDAWYGTSSAPYQHFEQARLRAIEQGRFLVRSANTGISGVVDPYGRLLARTELFVPAVASADVRLLDRLTLYARIGDAFAYACVALTALALVVGRRPAYSVRA